MFWKKQAGKKVFEFLTPKPNVKIKGQSTIEAIKKKVKHSKVKWQTKQKKHKKQNLKRNLGKTLKKNGIKH